MNRDRYSISYAQTSTKPLIHRAFTVLLVITGVTLLILARANHPMVAKMRAQLADAVGPAVEWVSQPVTLARGLIHDKNALLNAYEENKQLRAENETLRHWQSVATALKAENDSLRALAGYQPVAKVSYVTARVVSQSPATYSATLMINAGKGDGIKALQPVVDAYGLVGRIMDPGAHAAQVLLLSDSSSRIPVITANGRVHAIASGTGRGDDMLRLTFLNGDGSDITLGEPIVTTEEGGLIPGGIAIGTVFKRDSQGLLVKPVRPYARSEYVRVVQTQ